MMDLFENVALPTQSVAHSECEDSEVVVCAEDWLKLCNAYSADLLAESSAGSIPSVRVYTHEGRLYTCFSYTTGGYSGSYLVEAWMLTPRATYLQQIVTADAASNPRARFSYLGKLVQTKGFEMVCAKKVTFVRGLPKQRMSLSESMKFNSTIEGGWRAMSFSGVEPSWFTYKGYPVCCYRNDSGKCLTILFWKSGSVVREHMFHVDFSELVPATHVSEFPQIVSLVETPQPAARYQQDLLFA